MNKHIEELAIASGIYDSLCDPYDALQNGDCYSSIKVDLEKFAALVAAAEREACAKLCLEEANEAYHQEAFYLPRGNQGLLRIAEGAKRCAEAIRARGEQ
mgnify:CR=1 FL=1